MSNYRNLSVAAVALFVSPWGLPAQSAGLEYLRQAEKVVIDYRQGSGLLDYGEPQFGLKLFGDGKVVATLPEHFPLKKAERRGYQISRRGYFEGRLSEEEIQRLLLDIEQTFLIDTELMKREQNQRRMNRGRTDGVLSKLKISLTGYRPIDARTWTQVDKNIVWNDTYGDAKLHPDIAGIQSLWEAEKALVHWVFKVAQAVDREVDAQ